MDYFYYHTRKNLITFGPKTQQSTNLHFLKLLVLTKLLDYSPWTWLFCWTFVCVRGLYGEITFALFIRTQIRSTFQTAGRWRIPHQIQMGSKIHIRYINCLLYTSDAADE